jgi:hypothetical protein
LGAAHLMRRAASVTVDGGRERPRPENFGLPASFAVGVFERAMEQLEARRKMVTNFIAFVGLVAFEIGVYFYFESFGAVMFATFTPISVVVFVGFQSLFQPAVERHVLSDVEETKYGDDAQAYVAAVREWKFTQTEAGFGYWRDLKAAAFENAVASFFHRRGGSVELTKATGDGGVDIILKLGSSTYWCQCKGYAKPVAVAAIRQIAGAAMKSGGKAKPVMFSTNGYTKPALEEAATLGVKCIDGLRLSQMATRQKIDWL